MQRKTPFVEGEYYHLYNRGVDKREIFLAGDDYRRFMTLLYLANSSESVRLDNILRNYAYEDLFALPRGECLVAVGAFCLMPNHFHLLITPLVRDGVTRYMLKLQTAYSMYFNIKNDRNGSLFQGTFKSEHASNDRYLKYLFSYIHLNPVKLKDPHWKNGVPKKDSLFSFLEQYPYSSLGAYMNNTHTITNPSSFPEYFPSKKEVWGHIKDWLPLRDDSEQG